MLYNSHWNDRAAAMPIFGRRWHSRSRIDIRPVLWSLRRRPEEWTQTEFTLKHNPSNHEFWTANGFWFYGLYATDGCSCKRVSGGRFSFIQKIQFASAMRAVAALERRRLDAEIARINVQFAAHFGDPVGGEKL